MIRCAVGLEGLEQGAAADRGLAAGVSKLFRMGPQPVTAALQASYNVERPGNGPDWQLRLGLAFRFQLAERER